MSMTHILVSQYLALRYEELSPDTVTATINTLADSLACGLAGVHAQDMEAGRRAFAGWRPRGATVWGGFGQAASPIAALLNANSIGALDFEDTDDAVPLHASSIVVPALIADAEKINSDCHGHDFLTALAVGLDATMRIGRAGGVKGTKGWNWGAIGAGAGAVLAIARLHRWDAGMTVNALGHLLSQMSGSLQSIIESSPGMRFLPGFMARDVLFAVELARAGVAGPNDVFEGRAGFFALFQDNDFDVDTLNRGLGSCSLVQELCLKQYPACRFTHAVIDAALYLREQGLDIEQVDHIHVQVTKQARNMVGKPFDAQSASILDAQFSIPYTLAVALDRGKVQLADFTDEAIKNKKIADFALNRISVQANAEWRRTGLVPVEIDALLMNGERRTHRVDTVSGGPAARITDAKLRAKLADCIDFGNAKIDASQLLDTVRSLGQEHALSSMLSLLA